MAVPFFRDLWARNREFTLAQVSELYRTILVLLSLGVIYALLQLLRIWLKIGSAEVTLLENIDFGFSVATMVAGGVKFVFRQLVGSKEPPPRQDVIK